VGEDQIKLYPDGVFFVGLAPILTADFIISSIADAIQYSFTGSDDPLVQIRKHLEDKEMLLILDNFEHLATGGAHIVQEIVDTCGDVQIIITSRQRLNLKSEDVFEVKGMTVPQGDCENLTASKLEQYSSVALFLDRAKRIEPRITLNDENRDDIIRICGLVGGLPLAIELAAAWVRVISCREIAEEIERNLDFLATTQSNVPQRHRSVRAVFDYSWNLMTENERTIFRRLSIFLGGFTREAAGEIAEATVLTLSNLMDKSLVYRSFSGRYYILEVLRQYGEEKLTDNPDEYTEVRKLHSRFFAHFSTQIEILSKSLQKNEMFDLISQELDNIREGWFTSAELRDFSKMAEYIRGIRRYSIFGGYYQDGERLLKSGLDKMSEFEPGPDEDESAGLEITGKIQCYRAAQLLHLARYQESRDLYDESSKIFKQIKRDDLEEWAINGIGNIDFTLGSFQSAKEMLETCLTRQQQRDDKVNMMTTLHNLANVEKYLGNRHRAVKLFEQSLEYRKKFDEKRGIALTLASLGSLQDNVKTGLQYIQECLDIYRELSDRGPIALSLLHLGYFQSSLGDLLEAKRSFEESLSLYIDLQDQSGIANAYLYIGQNHYDMGNYQDARRFLLKALGIFEDLNYKLSLSAASHCLALIEVHSGDYQKAERIYSEILDQAEEMDYPESHAQAAIGFGSLCTLTQKYTLAEEYLNRAYDLYTKISSQSGMAQVLLEQGNYMSAVDRDTEASEFYLKCWEISKQASLKRVMDECECKCVTLKQKTGDPEGIKPILENLLKRHHSTQKTPMILNNLLEIAGRIEFEERHHAISQYVLLKSAQDHPFVSRALKDKLSKRIASIRRDSDDIMTEDIVPDQDFSIIPELSSLLEKYLSQI